MSPKTLASGVGLHPPRVTLANLYFWGPVGKSGDMILGGQLSSSF